MCQVTPNVKILSWLPSLLCVCGLLLPATSTLALPILMQASAHRQETDVIGTYLGQATAGDAAKREFTLDLAFDGSATLNTLYIGRHDATERGRWRRTGDEVELTFDAMGASQPPRPIIFRHHDHRLSPLHWDASEWGRSGPPVLHRSPRRSESASAAANPGPVSF